MTPYQPPPPPPARLFVLLACEASIGVILRHGPNRWVQMILWDTQKDTFTEGQWLHAKVFDLRCDVSPDGQFVICFVARINRRTLVDKEFTYSWTTISRPPYFTALALWPKGDSWNGGGLFETSDTVWLNHFAPRDVPHPDHKPQKFTIQPGKFSKGEDEPIYYQRLALNGWVRQRDGQYQDEGDNYLAISVNDTALWEKSTPKNNMVVNMEYLGYFPNAHSGPPRRFGYHVLNAANNRRVSLPHSVTWADFDQQGRLVLAKEGKLFVGTPENGELKLTELADFNANKPEQVIAPNWAQKW